MLSLIKKSNKLFQNVNYPMSSSKPSILFFGSDRVAFPTLKTLHQHFPNLNVVTQYIEPQRANKIKNQVEQYCKNSNIEYYTPIKQKKIPELRKQQWRDFGKELDKKSQKYSLGIVCSYGYMIPNHIIQYFSQGMIVIHPSILPKYRGGAPIFHAIVNGQKQSGVSYIDIFKGKFDFGNILHQVKQDIKETATYNQVQSQLAELAAKQIAYVANNLENLRPGTPQIDQENKMFEKLTSLQEKQKLKAQLKAPLVRNKNLPIKSKTAQEVYNWSRALQIPRVKFRDMQIIITFSREFCQIQSQNTDPQGTLLLKGKKIYMKCSDKCLRLKSWHEISKKQLEMHTFIDRFMTNPKLKKKEAQAQIQAKLFFQQISQ